MSDSEKLASAEAFVRRAVARLNTPVGEEVIQEAAKKAAKSLPPYQGFNVRALAAPA